jgi:hypothetical protein
MSVELLPYENMDQRETSEIRGQLHEAAHVNENTLMLRGLHGELRRIFSEDCPSAGCTEERYSPRWALEGIRTAQLTEIRSRSFSGQRYAVMSNNDGVIGSALIDSRTPRRVHSWPLLGHFGDGTINYPGANTLVRAWVSGEYESLLPPVYEKLVSMMVSAQIWGQNPSLRLSGRAFEERKAATAYTIEPSGHPSLHSVHEAITATNGLVEIIKGRFFIETEEFPGNPTVRESTLYADLDPALAAEDRVRALRAESPGPLARLATDMVSAGAGNSRLF